MVQDRPGFNHKGVLAMSIIMFTMGMCTFGIGMLQLFLSGHLAVFGFALWSGAIFFVTGSVGIVSWRPKSTRSIVALMVLCVITPLFAITELILTAFSLFFVDSCLHSYMYLYCRHYIYSWSVPFDAILIFMDVFVFVTSIVCSAFCCKAVCCCQQDVTSSGYPVSQSTLAQSPQQAASTQAPILEVHVQGEGQPVSPPVYCAGNENTTKEGSFDYQRF